MEAHSPAQFGTQPHGQLEVFILDALAQSKWVPDWLASATTAWEMTAKASPREGC